MSRDTLREAHLCAGVGCTHHEHGQAVNRESVLNLIASEPYWPRLGAVRRRSIAAKVAALEAEPVGLPAEPCGCDAIPHDVREHIASTAEPVGLDVERLLALEAIERAARKVCEYPRGDRELYAFNTLRAALAEYTRLAERGSET